MGSANFPVTYLPGSNLSLSGYAYYNNTNSTKLNGVAVQLRNSSNVIMGNTVTATNPDNGLAGYYTFTGLANGTYSLTGSYNGTWGGNNATDALLVQLEAGATPGTYLTGLRRIAGDVNLSTTITALDALYIKLRTVGAITAYPAGDWTIEPYNINFNGTPVVQDIKALCVGDVNGSFSPVGFKDASFLSIIDDGILPVAVGDKFSYEIHSSREADLGAMTIFLGYNQDRYEVSEISSNLDGLKYSTTDGKLSVAWSDTRPLKVKTDDLVLSLNMRVKEKLTEPSQVFNILAGSEFADITAMPYENFDLKMAKVITTEGSKDISLFNYPNPFANTTSIVYTLPEAGHARLVLTDLYGNTIHVLADRQETTGAHTVVVDPASLNMAPGVYLYKIIFTGASDTSIKVNKMVFTR